MTKLVIFDMDGLMLDTERLCRQVWLQVFSMLPPQQCQDDCCAVCGRSFSDTVAFLQARHPGLDIAPLLHRLEDRVDEIIKTEGVGLKSGLLELLDALEQKKIPKVVATSTRRERAEQRLNRTGILHRFDRLVCGDMVTHSKPDPEIFLLAARESGILPKACMVLEDSIAGITAASQAGMMPVMVPDMVRPDADTVKRAAYICSSLLDVIELLDLQ